uniref:PH domain-containing protein n=1 Tax=Bigelowiella natans TaxID=227086 RepID=A0A7S2KKW0_BIGNA|mmetsp:Transcript_249/g.340  ORF Transcript_249/g.340 Transcript_249/m.340 type:complete len:266 (+) Transcript_249:533-1330(+)
MNSNDDDDANINAFCHAANTPGFTGFNGGNGGLNTSAHAAPSPSPRRNTKRFVKSLFGLASSSSDAKTNEAIETMGYQFGIQPANSQRRYILGVKTDEEEGLEWLQTLGAQVTRLEKKIVASHTASTMEGYLYLLRTPDSGSTSTSNGSSRRMSSTIEAIGSGGPLQWARFYFILKGKSFEYHQTLEANQGEPLCAIMLESGRSSVQLLATDDYDRANCFKVSGVAATTRGEIKGAGEINAELICAANNYDEVEAWASAILSAAS